MQKEEAFEIPEFEDELGITFSKFKKADAQSIEENNTLLWARKIFKTKPNRTISEALKNEVRTVFHHLTKEELVEKILANYMAQTAAKNTRPEASEKKKN